MYIGVIEACLTTKCVPTAPRTVVYALSRVSYVPTTDPVSGSESAVPT